MKNLCVQSVETERLMADSGKQTAAEMEEKERLIDGMTTVLDFDLLCSTVAMQTHQGKWIKLEENYENDEEINGGDFNGGVFRMWEGEILDCFDDRRLALESSFWPWYRFGKNMSRAGFGSCFLQGFIYVTIAAVTLCNLIAFAVTKKHCFLYLGVAFAIFLGTYLGIHRSKMRKKFNIKGSDSCFDDCVSHLICPCCTLAQESRTLEINNVQDGIWHGRGDTICVGTYVDGVKSLFELIPPPIVSIQSPESCFPANIPAGDPVSPVLPPE